MVLPGPERRETGVLADRLCWLNGICGDNAEAAILATLRAQGVDPAALNTFVTKVHLGLQVGDVSIFKKAKKAGQ